MESVKNRFGEIHTKWTSTKHPDNPNFMQTVFWNVWEKEGKTTVCYNLGTLSKSKFIYGLTKDEAIEKFTDK